MHAHDSRRYHRPPGALERLRYYGKNQSSTSISSPYGQLPMQMAGRISRQAISPLLLGLGTGQGRAAQRLQADIQSGRAGGPLASAIQQIQQFAPGVISGATGIGQQVAQQGGQAVQGLESAIAAAQQQLPQWQQAAQQGLQASQQGLTGAKDANNQIQGLMPGLMQAGQQGMTGAQAAFNAAQAAMGGPAQQGAQAGMTQAQRFLQQQASPIAGEDIYQTAARRIAQQVNPQAAARGLEGGGGGQQMLTEANMNLAAQMAQQQAQNQQAALQGVTAASGNLGNITQQGITGMEGAAQGVQQAAQGQAGIAGSALPFVQALQQAGLGVQQGAQGGANIAMLGPQLAGQQANAIQQLGQVLMQQYQLPMQSAGGLLNLLTGGVSPGLQMLEATRPLATPSSKGSQIL